MANFWTKRNNIAAALFVFIIAAAATEYIRFSNEATSWFVYVGTVIVIMVTTLLWLFADAHHVGAKAPSRLAYVSAVLIPPIGVLIHLLQTRKGMQAVVAIIMAVLFTLMAAMIGDEIGIQFYQYMRAPR